MRPKVKTTQKLDSEAKKPLAEGLEIEAEAEHETEAEAKKPAYT